MKQLRTGVQRHQVRCCPKFFSFVSTDFAVKMGTTTGRICRRLTAIFHLSSRYFAVAVENLSPNARILGSLSVGEKPD